MSNHYTGTYLYIQFGKPGTITVMILSFRTDCSGQIVQTQIRLLLEEQSDQGLHYLQYCLHLLDALLYCKTFFFQFKDEYRKVFWRPKI